MTLRFIFPKFIKKALYHPAKHVVIAGGRRGGKTYNGALWVLERLFVTPAKSALWIETKHTNIDKYVERYFMPMLKPIGSLVTWNQQKKILSLPNGKYIDFGSAERPENLEGFEYDLIVVNEAGIILKNPALWDNTLRPMAKGKNTQVRFLGTPKGKNKFFHLFTLGQSGDKDWKSFRFTAYDSPYWDKTELDRIKERTPPEVWNQEYLAEFVDGGGQVFRGVKNRVVDHLESTGGKVMGIDLAKHQDFTVIMVADVNTKKVIDIDRFNQIDWSFQKQRILAMWERHGKPKTIIDSTGVGDAIFDDLQNQGMNVEGFKFTNTSKNDLIRNLAIAIDNANIFYPNNPVLISELESYSYEVSSMGTIRYNAPSGLHDDTVIALALVNHLLNGKETKIWVSETHLADIEDGDDDDWF